MPKRKPEEAELKQREEQQEEEEGGSEQEEAEGSSEDGSEGSSSGDEDDSSGPEVSEESAESDDDEDGEAFDEVQVEFQFFDPAEKDFHGLKALLANFLDGEQYDSSGLVDTIIKQVGSLNGQHWLCLDSACGLGGSAWRMRGCPYAAADAHRRPCSRRHACRSIACPDHPHSWQYETIATSIIPR